MTYWLINIPFLLVAAVVLGVALGRRSSPRGLPWLISAVVMMALTAVFDNAIIGTGIVAYDPEKISGITIGFAPIEDFAYTLLAIIVVPSLFNIFRIRL